MSNSIEQIFIVNKVLYCMIVLNISFKKNTKILFEILLKNIKENYINVAYRFLCKNIKRYQISRHAIENIEAFLRVDRVIALQYYRKTSA